MAVCQYRVRLLRFSKSFCFKSRRLTPRPRQRLQLLTFRAITHIRWLSVWSRDGSDEQMQRWPASGTPFLCVFVFIGLFFSETGNTSPQRTSGEPALPDPGSGRRVSSLLSSESKREMERIPVSTFSEKIQFAEPPSRVPQTHLLAGSPHARSDSLHIMLRWNTATEFISCLRAMTSIWREGGFFKQRTLSWKGKNLR